MTRMLQVQFAGFPGMTAVPGCPKCIVSGIAYIKAKAFEGIHNIGWHSVFRFYHSTRAFPAGKSGACYILSSNNYHVDCPCATGELMHIRLPTLLLHALYH